MITIAVVPAAISAQSDFMPLGGEFASAGALPADQTQPSVAVNAGGGYLVWQDQTTFGNRLTVMGRVLNSGFQPAQAPFRVNSGNSGDHENARVALLGNGGAVFVWQGGQLGFQHIYARFLSSSNTWLGLDQMINASTKTYQRAPSVAVLNNGNVIVVWESLNSITMRDVNAQLLTPGGVKIGSEFEVNQFTAFNQRSPVVAAMTNGGFVVAWVSEQQLQQAAAPTAAVAPSQFQLPSVGIYARLYDDAANPLGKEFQLNTNSNVAANPSVAAGADGSIVVAWNEKDAQVINNGWDIYARPFTFSSSGLPFAGVQQRINTQLYGDQFAPQIAAQGSNYMILWTSLGQDGSGAGVYGQLLNSAGTLLSGEFRLNTTTLGAQQQPALAADNNARFLATWTSPTFGPTRNDLFGQVYAGAGYVAGALATNYLAPVFVPDNSSVDTTGGVVGIHNPETELPVLIYPGQVALGSSNAPSTNALALAAGNYYGLFYEANGANPVSSGYFQAKTTKSGAYSGKIIMAGKSYSFAGTFDSLGSSPQKRIGKSNLSASLQLDLFGADQITGQISANGGWTATLVADRQVFDSKTNPDLNAGRYTMAIPGNAVGPGGSGFGTLTVGAAGNLNWAAALADGTKVSQSSGLSKEGVWPLFSKLGGGGCLLSWITVENNPPAGTTNQAVSGDLLWLKCAAKQSASYKAGFTNDYPVIGAAYSPPPLGAHDLALSGANLSGDLNWPLEIGPKYKVTNLGGSKMTLTIKPATGRFNGSAVDPGTGKKVSFQGVLLEGAGGTGYFLNKGQSGSVNVDPTHAP